MSTASRFATSTLVAIPFLLALAMAGCQSEDPVGPENAVPGTISIGSAPGEIAAPWFLLRGGHTWAQGDGPMRLENVPAGEYNLMWGPVPGWKSPTPNPLQAELAASGEITFAGTYVAIPDPTGSIAVDTNPDAINAPWVITGPSGFMYAGTGDEVLDGREAGDYTINYGEVPDYSTATQQQATLEPGGRIDFGGTYVFQASPTVGTILVDVNPDQINAGWVVSGPNGIEESGLGDASLTDMPSGDYTIRFEPVAGWDRPNPSSVFHTLADGEVYTCTGNYTVPGEPDPNAPSITGVSGTLANGGSVSISGANFGAELPDVVSTVGPAGWIESNSTGTPVNALQGAPGWQSFSAKVPAFVDDSRAHSGSRSINASVFRARDGDWNKILYYQDGRTFDRLYATWWVYFNPISYSDDTQWKMWRIGDEGGNSVASDNCGSLLQTSHWASGYRATAFTSIFHCKLGCQWPAQIECYQNIQPDPWYPAENNNPYNYKWHSRGGTVPLADHLPRQGVWCRAEIYIEASAPDTPNGRYWLTINRPGEPRKVIDNWATGLITRRSDCCNGDAGGQWLNFVLQGYFDDNGGPFQNEEAEIFYDDIYLQFGTPARVELGDDPDFDKCTQLEVQEVVSWSEGEVQIRLNRGGFQSGTTAWLFVVGADGRVSKGQQVTVN